MYAKPSEWRSLPRGKIFITLVICCATGLVGASAWAAHKHSPTTLRIRLRKLMTVDAYDRAGIDRLSTEQRQALERWLAAHLHAMSRAVVSARAAVPIVPPRHAPSSRLRAHQGRVAHFGLPPRRYRHLPNEIESRIDGVFQGWTGNTRFHLMNGQTWVQSGTGYFRIPKLIDPRVKIKKLIVGYVLEVRGYGEQVFVTRVR